MRDYAPKQGSVAYACLIELYQVRKIGPINELEARNCTAEAAVAPPPCRPGVTTLAPARSLQEGACPAGPRRREGLVKATLMELVEQRGLSHTPLDKSARRDLVRFGLHPRTASAAPWCMFNSPTAFNVCWSMLACQRK